ncbi:hypothetical protein HKCCE3408_03380 [Rhodobacterales bacterium HKCCE3408]|nr:hypothetical protein [Rhodobacterales bacterium HKCCE3408]
MGDPVILVQSAEAARFDPTRLESLCITKGELQAETEAAEALDCINRLLEEVSPAAAPLGRMRLIARIDALIASADKIGMCTLTRVARDVRACLATNDPVALAATLARLSRVGERSMYAIFDLEDQSV